MKNKTVRAAAILLSASLLMSVVSLTGCSAGETEIPAVRLEDTSVTLPVIPGTVAPDKDETVYVFAGPDGTVQNTIVSSWLKNTDRNAVLEDASDLRDIENVSGTETFAPGEKNTLTWDTGGNDIFYQGISDKKLPVELKISYTLDGKAISPEKLAGQSGKVTVRFDYENHETVKLPVNDRPEDFYVPFIMVTGVMLDAEVFRNVTVENGQMENMGNEVAVAGAVLPGMQENLRLSAEDFQIPDYIAITADVENFEMGPVMTIATTSFLKDFNTENLNVEDLKEQARKLADGMGQLTDGAAKLYDGLDRLLNETDALVNGMEQLALGAAALQTGTGKLTGGAAQLQAGAEQLSGGLSTLNANSDALNRGAGEVFCALLSSASTQLNAAGLSVPALTIGNYAEVLNAVITSLDETAVYQSALQQVMTAVESRRGEIEAAVAETVRQQIESEAAVLVTAAVREGVKAEVQKSEAAIRAAVILEATGLTPEAYQQAVDAGHISLRQQEAIEAAAAAAMEAEVARQMESDNVKSEIAAITAQKTAEKMGSEEVQEIIAQNTQLQIEKAISDTMASAEIQTQLQAAAEGAKTVIALKASLDSYNGFYLGLLTYTSGVSAAAAGAAELDTAAEALKKGTDDLSRGVNSLSTGVQTIHKKLPDLTEGITALRDGSGTLKDGLDKLMGEGIRKIADLAEEDLADLTARLSACVEAGKAYDTFSGKYPSASGTVKFIYKTESISTQ